MSRRALLAWCWTLVIMALCWTPRVYLGVDERIHRPFSITNLDKAVHLGIFAVFSFSWMRVESPRFRAGRILIAGLALAVITELGQETPFVNRDATLGDCVADGLGVVVGIVAYELLGRFRGKRVASLEA
jgi:VanZ family protein